MHHIPLGGTVSLVDGLAAEPPCMTAPLGLSFYYTASKRGVCILLPPPPLIAILEP